MMKKIVVLLLTVISVLFVAGCGKEKRHYDFGIGNIKIQNKVIDYNLTDYVPHEWIYKKIMFDDGHYMVYNFADIQDGKLVFMYTPDGIVKMTQKGFYYVKDGILFEQIGKGKADLQIISSDTKSVKKGNDLYYMDDYYYTIRTNVGVFENCLCTILVSDDDAILAEFYAPSVGAVYAVRKSVKKDYFETFAELVRIFNKKEYTEENVVPTVKRKERFKRPKEDNGKSSPAVGKVRLYENMKFERDDKGITVTIKAFTNGEGGDSFYKAEFSDGKELWLEYRNTERDGRAYYYVKSAEGMMSFSNHDVIVNFNGSHYRGLNGRYVIK